MKIRVETLPNGYGLTVNENKYLYFNEVCLLEGFIYHVGTLELNNIDPAEIREMVNAAVMAHADKANDQKVKQMEALTIENAKDVKAMCETVANLATVVQKIDEKWSALLSAVPTELRNHLQATDKMVTGAVDRLHDLEKQTMKTDSDLKSSNTVIKRTNEVIAKLQQKVMQIELDATVKGETDGKLTDGDTETANNVKTANKAKTTGKDETANTNGDDAHNGDDANTNGDESKPAGKTMTKEEARAAYRAKPKTERTVREYVNDLKRAKKVVTDTDEVKKVIKKARKHG